MIRLKKKQVLTVIFLLFFFTNILAGIQCNTINNDSTINNEEPNDIPVLKEDLRSGATKIPLNYSDFFLNTSLFHLSVFKVLIFNLLN